MFCLTCISIHFSTNSRPPNIKLLSGQWIRVSCTAIQPEEFHSLTLTSAPHEDYLSIHVKAQGPWTWKLRNYFQQVKDGQIEEDKDNPPKMRMEGNPTFYFGKVVLWEGDFSFLHGHDTI